MRQYLWEKRMKRRSFLNWGTAGLVALWSAIGVSMAAVVRFLTPSVFYEPPQDFKIGTPGDFSFGPPTFLSEEKIFVFRDREKGFAVANAVCTHLGCTVGYFQSDDQFHCPCHGSVFSADGKVLHGPAPRPLEWFEVTLARDGQLRVDKDHTVPATYRLMV
jgi:Rieske Fe-S protein